MWPSLAQRRMVLEVMDDPSLDEAEHLDALRGLQRINRASGSARILLRPLRRLLAESDAPELGVLDVATGGGDVPIELARQGLPLRISACDRSERAVAYARQHAETAGVRCEFFVADAIHQPLPVGYDVVMCSLFLHHVEPEHVVPFLRNMAHAARRAVLINDLERGPLGYAAAWIGTRLLSRSPVVHTDGPRSVSAALTVREVLDAAEAAGMRGAVVSRRWPFRFLLEWRKP